MPVTASSGRAKRLKHAKASLAGSAAFQTLVGAANETAALAFINTGKMHDESTDPDYKSLPRALVRFMGAQGITVRGGQSTEGRGEILVMIEFTQPTDAALRTKYGLAVDATITDDERLIDIDNIIGDIEDQILARHNSGGYLGIDSLDELPYGEPDPVTENGANFWQCPVILHYRGDP